MELNTIRRALLGMASGKIPAFFNHLDSGSFSVESGTIAWVSMQNITNPKGIIVFSDAFDLDAAKADKPMLGAYAACYIAGTDTLSPDNNGNIPIARFTSYFVNWGQNTDNASPTFRTSRTEMRGIQLYDPQNKQFYMNGFGTGEYDFKYNVTYNWIAWD